MSDLAINPEDRFSHLTALLLSQVLRKSLHPDFRPGVTLAGQCKDAENAKGVKQIRIKGVKIKLIYCTAYLQLCLFSHM